jgi:hypothetical protein
MTVRANTPLITPPQSGTSSDRLVYLAAVWARQTGRSIVVSDTAACSR